MRYAGYPPTHRNHRLPQPGETCEWCGLETSALDLVQTDADGLEGRWLCRTNPDCRSFAAGLTKADKRENSAQSLGLGRRLPGSPVTPWYDEDLLSE